MSDVPGCWILDDEGVPIPAPDHRSWVAWRTRATADGSLRVARTLIGRYVVSTSFLAVSAGRPQATPLLYETLVLQVGAGPLAFCQRYPTLDAARAGHQMVVAWCKLRHCKARHDG